MVGKSKNIIPLTIKLNHVMIKNAMEIMSVLTSMGIMIEGLSINLII
jgi:hypothetical protein